MDFNKTRERMNDKRDTCQCKLHDRCPAGMGSCAECREEAYREEQKERVNESMELAQ